LRKAHSVVTNGLDNKKYTQDDFRYDAEHALQEACRPGWRRMSPAPKRGEWDAGDTGAADSGKDKLGVLKNSSNKTIDARNDYKLSVKLWR
jgi:hypothetical protein